MIQLFQHEPVYCAIGLNFNAAINYVLKHKHAPREKLGFHSNLTCKI